MSPKFFSVHSHVIPSQHIRGYCHATADSQEDELKLAVKQYVPYDNQNPSFGDVTIIACHAAGFFKELYEPFFDDLYEAMKPRVQIRGIWIADTTSHGESSVLNEGKLGNDPCWDDHARDLLHMINTFRSWMPAPLIGIGHSMGGTNIVQLALLHPRLLSAVICIEPSINRTHKSMNFTQAYALSYRRDIWSSREEATAELKNSIMHRSWDKRVMERYAKYGLRDLPTLLYPTAPCTIVSDKVPVTLTTTKHHNVRSYARSAFPPPGEPLNTFQINEYNRFDLTKIEHEEMQAPIYRPEAILTFRQLPFLRPSCFYLYGAKSHLATATPQGRADKLEVTGTAVGGSGGVETGQVEEAVLDSGGHFIVFEKPSDVAEQVATWLDSVTRKWKLENEAAGKGWATLSSRDKAMLDDAWLFWVKKHYGNETSKLKLDRKKSALKQDSRKSKL